VGSGRYVVTCSPNGGNGVGGLQAIFTHFLSCLGDGVVVGGTVFTWVRWLSYLSYVGGRG
jgi:hypothetical protein